MKHIVLTLILIAGCTALRHSDPTPELPLPVPSTVGEVKPPEVVVPQATKPNIKFRLTASADFAPPKEYLEYAERARKFYELVVTDKTILGDKKFTYTTDNADQIRAKIMQGFDIEMKLYYPSRWKFGKSNVIAYHEDWVLYFNALKVKARAGNPCEIVDTIVHEGLHGLSFQHGEGYPTKADDDSVPYWLGSKAEEYCLAGKI